VNIKLDVGRKLGPHIWERDVKRHKKQQQSGSDTAVARSD